MAIIPYTRGPNATQNVHMYTEHVDTCIPRAPCV